MKTLVTTPESLPQQRRSREPWWRDLRVPSAGHRRFVGLVLPAAPWVFAAAGVAYAVMPAVVQDKLGPLATIYATVLTVLTLSTGALVQNFVPRLNRRTKGQALTIGVGLMTTGGLRTSPRAGDRDPVHIAKVRGPCRVRSRYFEKVREALWRPGEVSSKRLPNIQAP